MSDVVLVVALAVALLAFLASLVFVFCAVVLVRTGEAGEVRALFGQRHRRN